MTLARTGRHRVGGSDALAPDAVPGRPGSAAPELGGPTVATNMVTIAIAYFVPAAAGLLAAPIMALSLGVVGRGDVAAATAPLLLATTAATIGIPDAITYFVARRPAVAARVVASGGRLTLAAGVLSTAAICLFAGPLSGGDARIRVLILVASIAVIPTLLVGVLRGAAAGYHQWRLVSAEQVASAVVRLVALLLLAGGGVLGTAAATVIMGAAQFAGGIVYLTVLRRLRRLRAQPAAGANDIDSRALVRFGSRVWVGSLSGIVLSRLDQTVMAPLSSAYQLGLYAVAVNISEVVLIINNAVRDVTFAADAAERADARLAASARIGGAASLVFGAVMAVSMPWWVPVVFGSAFRPVLSSGWILIAAVVLITPGSIAGAGLTARGRPGLRSLSLVFAAAVNVCLLWLLVPSYGADGGAIATLVGNLVFGTSNLLFLWRMSGVNPLHFYGLRRSDVQLVRDLAAGLQRQFSARGSLRETR